METLEIIFEEKNDKNGIPHKEGKTIYKGYNLSFIEGTDERNRLVYMSTIELEQDKITGGLNWDVVNANSIKELKVKTIQKINNYK